MSSKRYLFRPSSAPALMLCGFYASNEKEDDEEAALGRQIHEYVEALVAGKAPTKGDDMEQQHIEACEKATDLIVRIIKKYHTDFSAANIEIEKRCAVVADDLSLITEGTPDITYFDVLIDIKSGLDFDIERHYHKPQVCCYALGQMRNHGFKVIHAAEVYVMPCKAREYDVSFNDAAAAVECVVARINDPMRKEQPNENCKYCNRLLSCPAINERLLTVQSNFGEIKDWIHNIEIIGDPQKMSRALTFAKIMEEWIDVVMGAAKKMSDENSGNEDYIPGFVRAKKMGQAEISDLNKAFQLSGVTVDGFMKACKLSLPKLGEQFKAQHEPISLENATKEVKGRLNDVILPGTVTIYLKSTKKKNKESF